MRQNEANGIKWFTFDNFDKTGQVKCCVTTRLGGRSKGRFAELNLGFSRGDDRDTVMQNYRDICSAAELDINSLVFTHQVHGIAVRRVDASDSGKSWPDANHIQQTDGLVTDTVGVTLVTFSADCVPLLFFDPVAKIIASAHAGWRGTADGIAAETVESMKRLGSRPENILAGIGPSIGECCFEVDEPVVSEFIAKRPGCESLIRRVGGGKSFIDLPRVNMLVMTQMGISERNIELSELCTHCRIDLFYSHRAMGDDRGSLAAFLALA